MTFSKKHQFAFLFALPALIILVLVRMVPLIGGSLLAFKNYSLTKGIFGSPWVGGANFEKLLGNLAFWSTLKNTLFINVNFILAVLVFSLILGISLSHIKNTRLFLMFCVAFILPFFIPQIFWNVLIARLFSTQGWVQGFNAEPRLYLADGRFIRLLYIAIEVIRWAGIFASLIAVAIQKALQRERITAGIKALFSILLVSSAFFLVTDFELLHVLVNPLVYEYTDTLSTYVFRTGMMLMDIGISSSLWLLKSLYCFVVLMFLLFFAEGFIKTSLLPISNHTISVDQTGQTRTSVIAIIINAIYTLFLLVIFLLLILAFFGLERVSMPLFLSNGIIYTVLAFISSAIGILLTILLAYPLTAASPGARKAYAIIFIMLLAAGQFGIHEYLFIKSLGMVNTYFAIIASSIFNPAAIMILGYFYNQKSGNMPVSFIQFVKTSFPAIACLFVATFLLNMDAYTSSLLYMNSPNMQSPSVQIYMGMSQIK